MKKYRKHVFYCIIIILIIFYSNYSTPRNYHKVYNGIKYRLGNAEYEESVSIELDGRYIRKVFSKNEFRGTIYINDDKLSDVNIRWDEDEKGFVDYWINSCFYSYGSIYISKNLEEITICVYESDNSNKSTKHWSTVEGLMISVPANNREEALLISNELMRKDLINREKNIIILK